MTFSDRHLNVSGDVEAIILRDEGRIVWARHADEALAICGEVSAETAAEVRRVVAGILERRNG